MRVKILPGWRKAIGPGGRPVFEREQPDAPEVSAELKQFMDTLSKDEADILGVLVLYPDKTGKDLSAILGLTPGQVRTILSRLARSKAAKFFPQLRLTPKEKVKRHREVEPPKVFNVGDAHDLEGVDQTQRSVHRTPKRSDESESDAPSWEPSPKNPDRA